MLVRPATRADAGLRITRAGRYRIPGWAGLLVATRVAEGGVALERLRALEARARQGGEQFQLHRLGVPRALKKQFQARGIPPWEREGPLLYVEGELLFVPGLGLDARQRAEPGQPQLALSWVPDVHSPAD